VRLGRAKRRPPARRWILAVVGGVLADTAATWLRAGRPGGDLVVRCRQGHLFTTLWIPAVSLKSLRLGPRRFQYCPVGRHWSLVTPVRADELSDQQRREASAQHDIRLP
jgi:hypothetical protein